MNTVTAMMLGAANRGREQKVFDWYQAAKIIGSRKDILTADAGLKEDFENTCGIIYDEGQIHKPDDGLMYLASTWATPVIRLWIKGKEDNEYQYEPVVMPCFVMASTTSWDAHTIWPQSALDILNSREKQTL